MIIDLCQKFGILQKVNTVTRQASGEILDLVFTSDAYLVSHVEVEHYPTFSDHGLVTCYTSYKPRGVDKVHSRIYLCDTGKRYGSLNFHQAPWPEIKGKLSSIDWTELKESANKDLDEALATYHRKVLEVLEELVPVKNIGPRKF